MTGAAAVTACVRCGTTLQPQWEFCAACGTPVVHTPAATSAGSLGVPETFDWGSTRATAHTVGRPNVSPPPAPPDPAGGWGEPIDDSEGWGPSTVDPAWPSGEELSTGTPTIVDAQPRPTRPGRTVTTAPAATFGRRLVARLVDGLILTIVGSAVLVIAFELVIRPYSGSRPLGGASSVLVLYVVWLLLGSTPGILYFALYESGEAGQTIGKRAFDIRVEKVSGGRLSFGQGLGRAIANIVAAVIFYLGQLAMLWDRDRRTWPDRWTSTRVVADSGARKSRMGMKPLAVAVAAYIFLFAGIPAGLRLATNASPSTSADPVLDTSAGPATTSPSPMPSAGASTRTSVPVAVAAVNPCSLASSNDVRDAVGVSVAPGKTEGEVARLTDDSALGMRSVGRKKCTYSTSGDTSLSPSLHLTTAVLIFSETYTTPEGAKAAFSSFRTVARAASEPDTTPFGPVGPTTLKRGFVDDLALGEGGFAYWEGARWSNAPADTTGTGPGADTKSEVGFMGVEFVRGRTCVVVAANGRIGDPADFPVIKRDVQAMLVELARTASRQLPAS